MSSSERTNLCLIAGRRRRNRLEEIRAMSGRVSEGRMAKRRGETRRRRIWKTPFVVAIALLCAVAFRQGWVPARYSPLPRLSLENPLPFVVDWQLAELRFDRRLCNAVVVSSSKISAKPIRDRTIKQGCGWRNAVSVSAIDGAELSLKRVSCPVAAGLALWVTHHVQPLAQKYFGQRVSKIRNMGTYACRNIIGSKFWKNRRSEHATANAIDIGGFQLANGANISVLREWKKSGPKSEFLRAVHSSACRYFRVTLGPDFNAAHKNHFHLDRGILYTCR